MRGPIRITALVDNTAQGRGLLAEHGLSLWIEYGDHRILFDTGQGNVLVRNARLLGCDLSRTDAIVLSHGHYDHTGGLGTALKRAHRPRVFMHPRAFERKFSRHKDGTSHEIGLPELCEQSVREQAGALIWTEQSTEVVPGLFVTGQVPRNNSFEDSGGQFFRDRACSQPDPLDDDQSIYFSCSKGVVVLLGCAHAGVINTLEQIQRLTGGQPIHAVMGGMHLNAASSERMASTLDALQGYEDMLLYPAHCTGFRSTMLLYYRFPKRCEQCAVGSRFVFE